MTRLHFLFPASSVRVGAVSVVLRFLVLFVFLVLYWCMCLVSTPLRVHVDDNSTADYVSVEFLADVSRCCLNKLGFSSVDPWQRLCVR